MTRNDDPPIRDAATIVLVRARPDGAQVLMGQRGAKAAFMPNKVVFPGGAVDAGDSAIALARPLPDRCAARVASDGTEPATFAAAAIRELWEETGLMLGTPGAWPGPVPEDWAAFAARGMRPSAAGLRYIFRAITPRGRPRRFDARFFLADAAQVAGDVEDFSAACDELSHLQWIPIAEARRFDLPFITEVVLAEVAALVATPEADDSVPFFDCGAARPAFRRIA